MRFSMKNKTNSILKLRFRTRPLLLSACLMWLPGPMGHPAGLQAATLTPGLKFNGTAPQGVLTRGAVTGGTVAPVSVAPDLALPGTVTVTIQPSEAVSD